MNDESDAKKSPLPDIDSNLLARRQLHVILALDCSGSMRGDRIASLNYAVRSAIPELQTVANENPEVQVMVRVLRFDTVAKWHIEKPCPVNDLAWTDLTAGGETAMGAALLMLAEGLKPEVLTGRQLPPVIVLVSDGYPTDDVATGLKRFFEEEAALAAIRLAIAIGADADRETLESFMDAPDSGPKPLLATNAPDLVQYIKWATSAPVKATSSPTNAPDPMAVLAAESADLADPDSEIVW